MSVTCFIPMPICREVNLLLAAGLPIISPVFPLMPVTFTPSLSVTVAAPFVLVLSCVGCEVELVAPEDGPDCGDIDAHPDISNIESAEHFAAV